VRSAPETRKNWTLAARVAELVAEGAIRCGVTKDSLTTQVVFSVKRFGLNHELAGPRRPGPHCAPVRAFRAVMALAQLAIMVLLATRLCSTHHLERPCRAADSTLQSRGKSASRVRSSPCSSCLSDDRRGAHRACVHNQPYFISSSDHYSITKIAKIVMEAPGLFERDTPSVSAMLFMACRPDRARASAAVVFLGARDRGPRAAAIEREVCCSPAAGMGFRVLHRGRIGYGELVGVKTSQWRLAKAIN
jgi:hypothetical protein